MITFVITVGKNSINICRKIGRAGLLLFNSIVCYPNLKKSIPLLIEEIHFVGVFSLVIIVVSGLFIGFVVGLQGYNTLNKFGATSELGQLLALSITRELGPVITALLFAGRAGSALTAEIGLMKTTEQLASMEMMGVNPLWRVIAPRFWAGLIAMPVLAMIFSAVAIYGGYLVGVEWLSVDAGTFWNNMQSSVDFYEDVFNGVIKSLVFGFVITWIAVYQGFESKPTAAGISESTTRTVVFSSLAILGLDFVLTAVMIGGW